MDELIKNSSGLSNPSADASSSSLSSSASTVLRIFKMLKPDFNAVKVPTGGSTAFSLQTSEGTAMVPALTGILLHAQNNNVLFRGGYTGGGTPPDCHSPDGITGIGSPGGTCASCSYNQFGSNGRGKLCKNRCTVYMLPEKGLPYLISLPPTSLDNFKGYMVQLLIDGKDPSQVITEITLVRALSKSGMPYSQAAFACKGVLDTADQAAVEDLAAMVKAYATKPAYAAIQQPPVAAAAALPSTGPESTVIPMY